MSQYIYEIIEGEYQQVSGAGLGWSLRQDPNYVCKSRPIILAACTLKMAAAAFQARLSLIRVGTPSALRDSILRVVVPCKYHPEVCSVLCQVAELQCGWRPNLLEPGALQAKSPALKRSKKILMQLPMSYVSFEIRSMGVLLKAWLHIRFITSQ